MKSMKRFPLVLVFALLFALVVSGCGASNNDAATDGTQSPSSSAPESSAPASSAAAESSAPPALTKVTLRLDWKPGAQHSPFYLAKEKGYFADQGIDLDIISGSGSADSVKNLGTNSVDLALVDALVLVQGLAQQVPMKAVAGYYQYSPISIISPAAKALKTPQDLEDKKIGTKKSSSTYQGLMVFLEANKMKQDQIKLVDIGFGVQPLLVNQVDAIMGFTMNEAIEAEANGMPVNEMMIKDFGVNSYGLTIAASDKFISDKGELLKGFLKAALQGMQDAISDPNAAVDALIKNVPELKADHELKVLSKTVPVWESEDTKSNGLGSMSEAAWQQTVDTATSLKLIEKALEVNSIFNIDYLK
jgi:NitT/TauT family transport system substrate-binding protein